MTTKIDDDFVLLMHSVIIYNLFVWHIKKGDLDYQITLLGLPYKLGWKT